MSAILTRHRLRTAALELFVEQGVAETTTRDLAKRAGIAEGTIYRHFESKDELVRDLFKDHYFRFGGELDRIQATEGALDLKLRAMIDYMCRLFDEDPTLYRFLLLVQHTALPNVRTAPTSPTVIFRNLITRAIERGEIPQQDPALAAAMVLGAVIQPALALIYGSVSGTMSDFAPAIASGCSALLRAHEPAATTH
ncbi:MAG TPA: TetR/AcrR family transcriptional regulator [Dongiaceae bacterium]|jgi:AcrR family transcriptional regulator|nr:TetR/AcrR family transcriptional regulator [Dongiaceae bacterium]